MMKTTSKLASVLVMGALLSLVSQSDARAAHPSTLITVTVTVVDKTCTFDEASQSVELDEITTRGFMDTGIKKRTEFPVTITCAGAVASVNIVPEGTPDLQDPTAFANTGQSSGVALRLLDASDNVLRPDGTSQVSVVPVEGKGSYRFRAGYVATAPGAVTSGDFVSVVTLGFNYD